MAEWNPVAHANVLGLTTPNEIPQAEQVQFRTEGVSTIMARTAVSIIGRLIAHFSTVPVAEAERDLEIAVEVVKLRRASSTSARAIPASVGRGLTTAGKPKGKPGPKPKAQAQAISMPDAHGPVEVPKTRTPRTRVRNRRKVNGAAGAPTGAPAATPAATPEITLARDAPSATELPPQDAATE